MSTPADIKATLARHLPELKKRYPIERLALFGSVTRNDFNPAESDIDILVEFNGDISREFFDLEQELANILGRSVDLVSKRALKSYYWEFVEEDMEYV
ncbi:MAG: nucleotidyltransferase [Bacteroidetes bacterium SW_11_45_7]|nr:MAG: nucleotidyltransferase [Bacteroidetes bacterium SW_11_45_7]